MMRGALSDITKAVGHTPIVRLRRVVKAGGAPNAASLAYVRVGAILRPPSPVSQLQRESTG